jgi:hypothetical protein
MKHYYTARRSNSVWYGLVYHYSNIDEGEVIDYKSEGVETSYEGYDLAREWADDEGLEVEMD